MITVHHLRIGRSIFTVWFLEELGLDYELKIYIRNDMGRAPPELKQAHPLGKSPVIDFGEFTLAESGAIATYLVDTYDNEHDRHHPAILALLHLLPLPTPGRRCVSMYV